MDALHNVLNSVGRTFDLRRAQRLSWDEARSRDIIFFGSPSLKTCPFANYSSREISRSVSRRDPKEEATFRFSICSRERANAAYPLRLGQLHRRVRVDRVKTRDHRWTTGTPSGRHNYIRHRGGCRICHEYRKLVDALESDRQIFPDQIPLRSPAHNR